MTRVVLDTDVIVSALLAPAGNKRSFCCWLYGAIWPCASPRPCWRNTRTCYEADNRIYQWADAAHADYIVTGNKKHFPSPTRTPGSSMPGSYWTCCRLLIQGCIDVRHSQLTTPGI